MAARRPRLLAQAWAEHRIARDLAARRALDAGPHRWATSALAAAAALAGAWIIYTVVPPAVSELNQRLNGLPTLWFAGILDMLGAVWESMSPIEKAALVLIGAIAVFLSGGSLGLAFSVGLGIASALDAARPSAQLMRDPQGTTGHYLDTHNDLQVITDTGMAAMAVFPGGKALRGAGYAAKTARTLAQESAEHRPVGVSTPAPASTTPGCAPPDPDAPTGVLACGVKGRTTDHPDPKPTRSRSPESPSSSPISSTASSSTATTASPSSTPKARATPTPSKAAGQQNPKASTASSTPLNGRSRPYEPPAPTPPSNGTSQRKKPSMTSGTDRTRDNFHLKLN